VRGLLAHAFPDLPYAAALLGPGSEVLGCDTALSADHDWTARLHILLRDEDAARAPHVGEALREGLPRIFRGVVVLCPVADVAAPSALRAFVGSARDYYRLVLGWDPMRPTGPGDWLATPSQTLLSLTAGAVFQDAAGILADLRQRLAWYPRDVWLYMLAAGWQRVGQEEHLMSRAGTAGDELGSALVGARLVHDLMGLAFLMERCYAPYAKWFGTLFSRLHCAPTLAPLLWSAQQAADWRQRESAFLAAAGCLVTVHNALGITPPLASEPQPFYGRPYRVIGGERLARSLGAAIADPSVRALLDRPLIGSVDQWSDSTDLKLPAWQDAVRRLYSCPATKSGPPTP